MKNLLLLIVLLITITVQSQITIKGITLGEQADESLFKSDGTYYTTLAGIEGTLMVSKLQDGRIYKIYFIPSIGNSPSRVYGTDVKALVDGISSKYNVKLRKTKQSTYSDDYYYIGKQDGIEYFILTEYNRYMTPTTSLTMSVTNIELNKIAEEEKKSKTSSDF